MKKTAGIYTTAILHNQLVWNLHHLILTYSVWKERIRGEVKLQNKTLQNKYKIIWVSFNRRHFSGLYIYYLKYA